MLYLYRFCMNNVVFAQTITFLKKTRIARKRPRLVKNSYAPSKKQLIFSKYWKRYVFKVVPGFYFCIQDFCLLPISLLISLLIGLLIGLFLCLLPRRLLPTAECAEVLSRIAFYSPNRSSLMLDIAILVMTSCPFYATKGNGQLAIGNMLYSTKHKH